MGKKSMRQARSWDRPRVWLSGQEERVTRPEWRDPPAQCWPCLHPESKGATGDLPQECGRSDVCVTKNKNTLEGRSRGRDCRQGYKWGLASCSSPVRLWSLLLQEAFPDHSPCGPICALSLWLGLSASLSFFFPLSDLGLLKASAPTEGQVGE